MLKRVIGAIAWTLGGGVCALAVACGSREEAERPPPEPSFWLSARDVRIDMEITGDVSIDIRGSLALKATADTLSVTESTFALEGHVETRFKESSSP